MSTKPNFIALLTYLPSTEGKQTTPISSGHRSLIKFPFYQEFFIGIKNFAETDLVFPGDKVTAEITLLENASLAEKIYTGLDFDFYEGTILIGHGIITKIL